MTNIEVEVVVSNCFLFKISFDHNYEQLLHGFIYG